MADWVSVESGYLLQRNRIPTMITRRKFGRDFALGVAAAASVESLNASAQEEAALGAVRGEPTAEKAGMEILAAGGNAIDAVVASALVAAVVVPHQTGIGGYGGHATLAVDGGRKITSIDFNSMAPAAMRADTFAPDADGKVAGQKNMYGWLAAGVPGILAGLELALNRYGTKHFREVVQPAIRLAKNGFPFGGAGVALKLGAKRLGEDPGSRELYFRDGKPLEATDRYSNPDLARLLESLSQDNSVESFYRGDIAKRIAAAFAANGGIVTAADMAAYQAREVEPLKMAWGDWTIHTAPLTAGGATILEAMMLLQELKWAERDPAAADTVQLQVEAFRYAWQDRLEYLGDPEHVKDKRAEFIKLLSESYYWVAARGIAQAIKMKHPLPVRVTTRPDQGTIHLSAVDKAGNLAALTLTHGGSFGSGVTVSGLGLTLGHGMSRFDPHPGHPNGPGPHKRPLNNMCPTIVAKNGRPVVAVGARGGRKIPNAVAEVLLGLVARGQTLPDAAAAPRMHTEGTLAVSFERAWPTAPLEELKQRGYAVSTAASATISAVGLTDDPSRFVVAMR
jgi:gamma-glutamyltranspeptidase / glutathione hydrolase